MGLTGLLRQVAVKQCPHCHKEYGKHSKKNFMKCLYTANYNLYNVVVELNELKKKHNESIPQDQEIIHKNDKGETIVKTPEGDLQLDVPEGVIIEAVTTKKGFKGEVSKDDNGA